MNPSTTFDPALTRKAAAQRVFHPATGSHLRATVILTPPRCRPAKPNAKPCARVALSLGWSAAAGTPLLVPSRREYLAASETHGDPKAEEIRLHFL